jgi:hypothetical protein
LEGSADERAGENILCIEIQCDLEKDLWEVERVLLLSRHIHRYGSCLNVFGDGIPKEGKGV